MQTYENQDEINIFELIDLFRRNLVLVVRSVIISLLVALLLSGISYFMTENVEVYSLTTNISVSGTDAKEQIITMINNSLSHSSTIKQVETKLKTTFPDYSVVSKKGSDDGVIQLIVEGPDKSSLTSLSNEIFNIGKPIIETAFSSVKLRKLEASSPVVIPQSTQPRVNWVANSIFGVMLGGMLSVFYIFAVYFMSPNIVQDNELESLFKADILGKFVGEPKKQAIRKFLEVR